MRCLVFAAVVAAAPALADERPYAGLEGRDIATLSESDIAELTAGAGWGLALSAELNGYPGPAHVLEHADALELSEIQRAEVEAIFGRMQAAAQALGPDVIAAEAELDRIFEQGEASPEAVAELSKTAGASLAELRAVHLAAHLELKPLLTRHQIMTYTRLRGYASGTAGHGGHGSH